MKEIICTNCKDSFEVTEDHFHSRRMEFNCGLCGVDIKYNEENGAWEALEKRPVPEKENGISSEPIRAADGQPKSIIGLVYEWRDRVIVVGWLFAAYYVMSFMYALLLLSEFGSYAKSFNYIAVVFNIFLSLLLGYFVGFLLTCLAKHLENQSEMIKFLKE